MAKGTKLTEEGSIMKASTKWGVIAVGYIALCTTGLLVGPQTAYADADEPRFITTDSGNVIPIPERGEPCKFDPVYCVGGWNDEGRFPFIEYSENARTAAAACEAEGRNHPVCPEPSLVPGGASVVVYPCYELRLE